MWTHVPTDFLVQVCRVPESLSASCSVPLSPTCGLGWEKELGPDQSQLCHFTILCVGFSSSPGVGSLFFSLQVVFRVSCFCCSYFLGVYVGGGFCFSFLLCHLFQWKSKSHYNLFLFLLFMIWNFKPTLSRRNSIIKSWQGLNSYNWSIFFISIQLLSNYFEVNPRYYMTLFTNISVHILKR